MAQLVLLLCVVQQFMSRKDFLLHVIRLGLIGFIHCHFSIDHHLLLCAQFSIMYHLTQIRFSRSAQVLMHLLLETIDMVNCFFFISQTTLPRLLTFVIWVLDYYTYSNASLNLFLWPDLHFCSAFAIPPCSYSNYVVVSISIGLLLNSKRDFSFHCIASNYSHADQEDFCDYPRDVPQEDIFNQGTSSAVSYFVSVSR